MLNMLAGCHPSCLKGRWITAIYLFTLALSSMAMAEAQSQNETKSTATNVLDSGAAPSAHHKPLMPLSGTDIGLFLIIAVALFIASGAGVGGGVLVVPSLLVISQFSAIAAVALSNVTILASSVANLGFNLPRRHPLRRCSLIDWDLVLLFGPPTVVGSIAGSYINMTIPSWVTKVCLFLLLIPMAWRMVDKAISLYRVETANKRAAAAAASAKSYQPDDLELPEPESVVQLDEKHQLEAGDTGLTGSAVLVVAGSCPGSSPSAVLAQAHGSSTSLDGAADTLQDIEAAPPAERQPTQVPATRRWLCLSLCWQRSSAGGALGGPAGSSGVTDKVVQDRLEREQLRMLPRFQTTMLVLLLADVAGTSLLAGYLLMCGTWQYWLLVLSPLAVMLLVWAAARHHVLWKAALQASLQLATGPDLHWNGRNTVVYPALCISAGMIAGMLGLGGGLVLAPLMLELGVNPAVSAASTQVTLLISSSTSAIVYALGGAVPWDYGVVLVVLGFCATLLGQWLVSWLVKRLGRPSILVVTLAVMFSAATFAAAAVVVVTAVDLSRHPEKWVARKGVCVTH